MNTIEPVDTLTKLKSLFLHYLDFSGGQIQMDEYLSVFLQEIKELFSLEEAALYLYDEWKGHLYMSASTERGKKQIIAGEEDLAVFASADGEYYYKSYPVPCLAGFQTILPVKVNGKMAGLVALKEKKQGVLGALDSEKAAMCSREFTKILLAALSISKVFLEEQRYKQLYRVTEKFHSSMNMDAVLKEVITTLEEVYPGFVYYLLLSHDNDSHGDLPIRDLGYDHENAAAMQAYVTGTVQFEDLPSVRKSLLYAPLKGKQGVYGVLQVIAPDALTFPASEVEFISVLAHTAGNALENAQLYQQSKRLISDLQLINETSHKLNSNLRLSDTMDYMRNQIMKSFNAHETGFILLGQNGAVNILTGSTGFFKTEEAAPYVEYVSRRINSDRESLFIGDISTQCPQAAPGFHSMMAVPMMESNMLKGFAVVLHREPYYFSFEMFKLLQSLIHHSSLALSNSMLREELEKMVITDHLTRLYSRSYLDEKILHSMATDMEGTFILIDIDDFKKVNDTYGHQIGDEILVQVAQLIQSNIRGSDIGARWGGEELAIYLPRVPLEAGIAIAERLLVRVRESSEPAITISCGISSWSAERSDNAKDLFKRADEALYQAKSTGKNKVLVHSGSE